MRRKRMRGCQEKSHLRMRVLIAILIVLVTKIGKSMKTIPPDEIIAILDKGRYNKHHLPTHFAGNASSQTTRIVRGPTGWSVKLEHYQNVSENRVRLVQRNPSTGRISRISMNHAAATELSQRLASFLTFSQLNGIVHSGVGSSDSLNRTLGSSSIGLFSTGDFYSAEIGNSKQETLHSGEIRVDPLRLYFINFLRKNADVSLLITEAKGAASRSTITIPSRHWQTVYNILDNFVNRKFTADPGPPTQVLINVYIEGMSSFRAQSMDFHVDIYLAERWQDPRLSHSGPVPALLRDWSIFERLWHPDLYFANAKDAKYHSVTAQNFGMYIWPNGSIYLDVRVSLVVNCMMDLSHFPLDTQECFLRILSYAYDRDHLNLTWLPYDNITQNPDILLPDMDLVSLKADYCDGTYAIGTWSCALARFKMRREIMHHILQSYIPTALIVVISWFSFWLDADSVPGRVSLCITTLLTLATQAQAAKMSLPQVSYAKAIDVWMGMCMAFVFGVMIEFTVVNYISRRTAAKSEEKTRKELAKRRRTSYIVSAGLIGIAASPRRLSALNSHCDLSPRDCDTVLTPLDREPSDASGYCRDERTRLSLLSVNGPSQSIPPPSDKPPALTPQQQEQRLRNRRLAGRVDSISRYIFPFSFLLFNAIYWPYYLKDRDYASSSIL